MAERVPEVQAFFVGDLQLIRTRIETELSALYQNEPVFDEVSEATQRGTSPMDAPKFDFSSEAKRDFSTDCNFTGNSERQRD